MPFFLPCRTHINYILTAKKKVEFLPKASKPIQVHITPLSSFPQQANNSTLIAPVNFRRLKFSAFRDKQKKKMIKEVLLVLSLASGLTLSVSESLPASLLPHTPESFNISYIQVLLASHHEPNWKIRNRLVIFLSIVLLMHNVKGKTYFFFFVSEIAEERGELFLLGSYIY